MTRKKWFFPVAVVLPFLVALLDARTPLGYGVWAFYLLPVLVVLNENGTRSVITVAGITSVLLGSGIFLSEPAVPLQAAILNRTAAFAALVTITMITVGRTRAQERESRISQERDHLLAENRQQREFLEKVLESTPVGIAAVRDSLFRYEFVNTTYALIAGTSIDRILGKTISDIFPDYVAKGGMDLLEQCLSREKRVDIPELETAVGFGESRRNAFFNVSFVPLGSQPGKPPGVLIVANEVTELVVTRKRIQETAARDEAILNNINDGLVIMSPGGSIEYMNAYGLAAEGYTSMEQVRKPLPVFSDSWLIYDESGRQLRVEQWPLARALREDFKNEIYRGRRLDKDIDIYCSFSGKPVFDQSGTLIGAVATFQDITEVKRAERLAWRREQEYRMLAENSPEVIARFDRDLRYTYVNRYGEQVYGIPRDEVIGKTNGDLGMPPEKVAFWNDHFETVLQTGRQETVEFDFESPAYGHQHFSSLFVPETDGGGEVVSILTITRDITDIKKTETRLRESEAFGRKILDSSLNGIYIYDLQTEALSFVNKQFTRLTGYGLEELRATKGEAFLELFHPEDRARVASHIRSMETLQEEDALQMEFRFLHKGGTWIWCLSRETVFTKGQEGGLRQYIGAFVDITQRKQAEEALREEEERFRDLADSMPQLVWTARVDGTIDYYNKKYRDFGGISPDPGGSWSWGPVVHDDDLVPTVEAWNRSVATGQTYQIEHRVRHADGTFHWYLSRGVAVYDEYGNIGKWYGTATNIDISKEAQAKKAESENRLKIMNENLESLIVQRTEQVHALSKALTLAEQRERKRFSYVLHENLQQLLLGAKLLLGQHMRDHSGEVCEGAYDEVAEGSGILDRALETTRALSIELNPPILRTQGLDTALEWLASHMDKTYEFEVDLRIEGGGVGDIREEKQLMLTQMVRELLNNVKDHSGVKRAEVKVACTGHEVQLSVTDQGKGFNTGHIFSSKGDESHLGLISIRERLRLFGGNLLIVSAEGKGARVEIRLPVSECEKKGTSQYESIYSRRS